MNDTREPPPDRRASGIAVLCVLALMLATAALLIWIGSRCQL